MTLKHIKLRDNLTIATTKPLYRYIGKIQPTNSDLVTLMSNNFEELSYQLQLIIQSNIYRKIHNAFIIDTQTGDVISVRFDHLPMKQILK